MRKVLRFLARPGVYILFVGLLVVSAGLGLRAARSAPAAQQASRERPAAPARVLPRSADRQPMARGLLNMAGAAYEEPLGGHLEDAVRQADFALVQAMLRCNIPLEEAHIEKAELRHAASDPYHFQRIRLTVGQDPLPFVTGLHESLRAWAENAEIVRADEETPGSLWTIVVNGVVTHELMLASLPSAAPRPAREGPGILLRRRAPGEEPRLAIVIDDLGEDINAARTLSRLPYPVTFAVWPRSTHARRAAEIGHAAGREIIVHQPAEPIKYPEMNPGPAALFASLPDREIEARVRDSLARVPYAAGMNNHMGSRFTQNKRAASAMARPLKDHGLYVLDSLTHPGSVLYAEARRLGIPALKRDIFLDAVPGKGNVLRQLRKAENIALVSGSAVVIGHPLPDTLAALREWGDQRDGRIELVRLSDLLSRP